MKKTEINKLDKILTDRDISHEMLKAYGGVKIRIPDFNGYRFSILFDKTSRGFSQGLLEVFGNGRGTIIDPIGYLHAEEAMDLMEVIVS